MKNNFKQEYASENPFLKKNKNVRSYADVVRQTRSRSPSYQRRNQNWLKSDRTFDNRRPRNFRINPSPNTYRERSASRNPNLRRNRFQNGENRNNYRQNQSRFTRRNLKEQNELYNTEINNNYRNNNRENTNNRKNEEELHTNNRFLDRTQRYRDTRWFPVMRNRR